jgi:hypothetical protein
MTERASEQALSLIGAPGFEPGTSCPPGYCEGWAPSGAEWQEVASLCGFQRHPWVPGRLPPCPTLRTYGLGLGVGLMSARRKPCTRFVGSRSMRRLLLALAATGVLAALAFS